MTERARTLRVGGILLALVVAGLVLGFVLVNRGNGTAPKQTSSPAPTDPKAQVEQAYLRYWDVYADALLRLDTAKLGDVLTGEALANVRSQVEQQRTKNEPVRVRVEHNYRIVIMDATTSSVDDTYVNHAVRIDPQTKQPTEADPNESVRRTYTLKKVDGVWKVSNIIGYRSGSPSP
ncbi:MAG: IMS domain-containing protein [Actinomycetota bacterium]